MELIRLHLPSEEEIEFQIAVVDAPAIESNWMAFKKESLSDFKFQEFDKSKKLLMGYFMIADKKIPRVDHKGKMYEVKFEREAIDKIVRNFSKNGLNGNMNEMHQSGKLLEGVYVLHHWQLDSDLGIVAPKGFKQEANGSWFGIVRCENEEIYNKALNGEYNGFSIEGSFLEEQVFRNQIDEFFQFIENLTK
jgi:hypothetical protein